MEINETAGIHQIYIKKKINPTAYLDKHYRHNKVKGLAA
jgi:hypothetical protein